MSKPLRIIGSGADPATQKLAEMRERARARAIPFHAQLYLLHKCNLRCQHCFEDESTHPTATHLSLAEMERILDELAALGCLQLTLTGGEIFLRRDLLDILALAKARRFQTTLFTSGYFIDEAMAHRLRGLGVGQVDISVYSDRAEDHDAFTQVGGSWARSTQALAALSRVGVKATLKCVLTTFNIDRIDDIVRLAHSLGVCFQFDPNVRPRMSNDVSTMRFALSADVLRDKVFSRRDLYPGFRTVAPERICRGAEQLFPGDAMCGAGASTLAITADGNVLPCGFFPISAGNIRQSSLRAIWEGSALLEEVRTTTYGTMSSCVSCDLRSACHPCMAYGQVERGDFRACNSASRSSAMALMGVSERAARANTKASRGRALSIVGERSLPDADGNADGVLGMFD